MVNKADGGYDHVTEFIPIAQPTADTLAKLATLQASNLSGDRWSSPFYELNKLHVMSSRRRPNCCC
jgi:hypothetical protein